MNLRTALSTAIHTSAAVPIITISNGHRLCEVGSRAVSTMIRRSVFRRSAQLLHRRPDRHLEDALIAATALVRDLAVATRNTGDFKPFGVRLTNPFA